MSDLKQAVERLERATNGYLPHVFSTVTPADLRTVLSALSRAEAELERERMRLAACGVVAMSNTPETAAKARDMHADYRSASCDDVAKAVDREMSLRAERDLLAAEVRLTRKLFSIGRADVPGRPTTGMLTMDKASEVDAAIAARAATDAAGVLEPRSGDSAGKEGK